MLRNSIVCCGPGQHTGTKWVWSAPSSVIIRTQNMHLFSSPFDRKVMRQWVRNSFVTVQTTDVRLPLQMPGLEMDAERKRRVVSDAYAMIFAGFNGLYLSTDCDNFKQNKNLHLMKSLIFSIIFNQNITKIRACF